MQDKIAIVGECMLELTRRPSPDESSGLPMAMSYGGDTLNCAVYMARLGASVDYVTALGDDSLSAWMIEQWRNEGVGCDLVDQRPNSVPGLYMIEVDERGERSFHYWRDSAPAKRLFDEKSKAEGLFEKFHEYKWICLSGISLAIYSDTGRQHLFACLAEYRRQGGTVIFDDNYRPKLWESKADARKAYEAMLRLTDIALPTVGDEQMLFGDSTPAEIIARLEEWGVAEIVLKMDEQGCTVSIDGDTNMVPANKVDVVDTTSAGDSFNAAYLAARLKGCSPQQAATHGHELASIVIQHRGAIIPKSSMPAEH